MIKITFDPRNLKPEDEAWPAFQAGGMTLVFWALFKRQFNTNQHFRPFLVRMADHIKKCNDKDDPVAFWSNIDEFWVLINDKIGRNLQFSHDRGAKDWLLKHWDYFNPSIQRGIVIEYAAERKVLEWMMSKDSSVQIREEVKK